MSAISSARADKENSMNKKQTWVAIGAVIGGLAGVVANLTMPPSGNSVLGPALLVTGIVFGGFIGSRPS